MNWFPFHIARFVGMSDISACIAYLWIFHAATIMVAKQLIKTGNHHFFPRIQGR